MYWNGQQSLVLQAVELSGDGRCDYGGSGGPASYRDAYDPTGIADDYIGFRPALYVKL